MIDRREWLVFFGAALLAGPAGCTTANTGGSSHVGRRSSGLDVAPLRFSAGTGMRELNAVRRKFGAKPFSHDRSLQKAAQAHANYMARTGNYGHEFGPETRFAVRIANAGFDGAAGENIGVGYGSSAEAIEGWLKSARHRKIMLRRDFDRAGLAYAFNRSGRNARYTHFWVMIAGSRAGKGVAIFAT
jgi:hypothetical protein